MVGPLEAVLRHRWLVIVPTIALALVGLAIGLLRDPVYTAESRINVGRVDVPAYTLQGVTIGNATLASSYARTIQAPAVIDAGARAAGISLEDARGKLSGSQIPRSTLIQIEAEGDSEEEAQELANGAAQGLIKYVTALNVRQQDAATERRFRRAQARTERARTQFTRALRNNRPDSRAVERARLRFRTAEVRSRAAASRLIGATIAPDASNLLQLIVPADNAESDESSVLQKTVIIGLVAGLVLGVALALLRANRRRLRQLIA